MYKVKITILESKCRCSYHGEGDTFIVQDICPPICHELWHSIYPMVYALQNGGSLEYGEEARAMMFEAKCPDGGRVVVRGERYKE